MRIKTGDTFDSNLEFFTQEHLRSLGFEIVHHDKSLPGKPDIVLPRERVAVFVHGCFWHAHEGCRDYHPPTTRPDYWTKKFARTQERDRLAVEALQTLGYRVATVWGCSLRHAPANHLRAALKAFVESEIPVQEFDDLGVTLFYSAVLRNGGVRK